MQELTFKDYVPDEAIKNYFDLITQDKDIFVCLIEGLGDKGPIVYIESAEDIDVVAGSIRVFLNNEDVRRYGKTVAHDEKVEVDKVKKWSMSYSALINYMIGINKKRIEKKQKGISAIATIIHSNKLVDIDVIYTPDISGKV